MGKKEIQHVQLGEKMNTGKFPVTAKAGTEKETVIVKEISVIKERHVLWTEIAQNPEGKTIPS